jgi:hypothetical protein
VRSDTTFYEKRPDGFSPALSQAQVVGIGTNAIGVAFYGYDESRVLL